MIHSASLRVPCPSVIRLRYMVKVPFVRRAALSRRAIFARDDHRCQYCGERADSIDHVVPRSKGGPHTWENVAAACRPCNLTKRDRTPDEAGMRLARPCRAPRATAWVVVVGQRHPRHLAAVPADGVLSAALRPLLARTHRGAGPIAARPADSRSRRYPTIWWHEVTAPALVLGSSQDESTIDRDACRACRHRCRPAAQRRGSGAAACRARCSGST